jgi:hypothetical protein
VAHGATGGGEAGGWLWLQLEEEEEEEEACKGKKKLAIGTVGVAEERVVALAAVRKDKSFSVRWLLLLLLGLRWQRIRVLQRRERSGATNT